MTRVVIIGGGFAGLAAASRLRPLRGKAEVTLIDRKATSDFLPMLPDVIGGRANPDHLSCDLVALGKQLGFRFVCDTVIAVDLQNREVRGTQAVLDYDYLVIASGSETNFYGRGDAERHGLRLDAVEDARRIAAALHENAYNALVVAGGGYTGVEVATNLWAFCRRRRLATRIVLCERGPSVLKVLPEKFQRYVAANLARLRIDVRTQTEVAEARAGAVALSSGETIDRALLIWTAGVHTAEFVRQLPVAKNGQGRLDVDEYLRISEHCFVAGDAARYAARGAPLRMSVQFSLDEGHLAGANIVRVVRGQPLMPFRPRDLGYVVPLANNRGCGIAVGVPVRGLPAMLLHYFMCIFRSRGLARRLQMIGALRRLL